MASAADGQARQTAAVFRGSDRVLFDVEGVVWAAVASKHGVGGKCAEAERVGLGGAAVQHGEPSAKAIGGEIAVQSEDDRAGVVGGQHGGEVHGGWRMEAQKAWGGTPQAMAQSASGDRRRHV